MDKERFQKQLDFCLEIDKEKTILRQTHISDFLRQETDAEHAWHMALMIYLLREYANEKFDVSKAMVMALIHDVVEIDAGDAYAYDTAALATQSEKEAKAAERIFGLLPDEQKDDLKGLFEEFEENQTPEAKFAHAIDNLQPLILNDLNNGGDWRQHGVKRSQVTNRQEKTKLGSLALWEYAIKLIDKNVKKGNIKDE